jgi:catechol 2,3-dioxygenase-like lactoylglutathione lyase family enzyme
MKDECNGYLMSQHPLKIDHVGVHVTDLQVSKQFYVAALAPLGMSLIGESDSHAAFGIKPMPYLCLYLAESVTGPTHLALEAETRAQVDAFHQSGINAGGTDGGAPGLRLNYHPDYYGAFVLDPDGHNIELVKHAAE